MDFILIKGDSAEELEEKAFTYAVNMSSKDVDFGHLRRLHHELPTYLRVAILSGYARSCNGRIAREVRACPLVAVA